MKHLAIIGALFALVSPIVMGAVVEKTIHFDNGLGSAVLYYDEQVDKPHSGTIVVHEWWGLNEYSRQRARALAELGYPSIAVDMYGHGNIAEHAKDAKSFMNAALAEPEKMQARFEQARQTLTEQGGVPRTQQFAIGYCFGGAVVLGQARSGADLAGVASFHGSLGTQTPAKPGVVKAKLLVATGGADPMVPPEQVAQFVQEMGSAGAKLELLSFPGAKHSFTNPAADAAGLANDMPLAYDEEADTESWAALLRFIGATEAH
jgi:dienelactone hydrolase